MVARDSVCIKTGFRPLQLAFCVRSLLLFGGRLNFSCVCVFLLLFVCVSTVFFRVGSGGVLCCVVIWWMRNKLFRVSCTARGELATCLSLNMAEV